MPGQTGGKLDAIRLEIESPAYPAQVVGCIEPNEPMMVLPFALGRDPLHFVDQSEPAVVERDRLRAASEQLCCVGRRGLQNSPRRFVHDPDWIAEINKLQLIA